MKHSLATVFVLALFSVCLFGACRSADAPKTSKSGLSYVIDGQVKHPGVKPFEDDLTVFEAISAAKPIEGSCDLQHVRIARIGKNAPLELVIDIAKMLKTGDSTDNILIQPGDVIVVPALGGS